MKALKLNTDFSMPIMGLGTWKANPGEVYNAIRWAIKLGYRHVDCAAIYGNEKEVGQALHDAVAEGDIKREELFITSKLWNDAHASEDVLSALKQTISDLQVEYLDLYLMHWPVAQKKGTALPHNDADVISLDQLPLEHTWVEMEKIKRDGLVRSIGVSNFGINNLQRLIEKGDIIPAVNQIECHPLLPQDNVIDFCSKNEIVITAYSSLGTRDSQDTSAPNLLENAVIKEIAMKLHATPAQVLLAWQLMRGVAVIPKTVHEDRLRENYAAQAIELDRADVEEIAKLANGHRFIDGTAFAYGNYTPELIFA